MRKAIGGLVAVALMAGTVASAGVTTAYADEPETQAASEYTLYPVPQSIAYDDGSYILRDFNVIYDDAIDDDTRARLEETAELKSLDVTTSEAPVSGKTNVYVGVHGSGDDAEAAIETLYQPDDALFEETDSYFLKSDNGTISVLGRDTDSSFYGLTTLYQVLGQLDSLTIRNFTVNDYADVVSRGFIEGYYGNPWSTQDRINLMTWGGYYKLNSYFYAPKDDPKHNAQWRTLYTDEEIETKIKPLAEAGNKSKTRFVFALHPYMNNPISYASEEAYQADLKVMQAKFAQVIEAGVRQIAILADDANHVGNANYTRTLEDMVAWLKEMQKTYPDLKTTLPFCPQEYMGSGQSYYDDFPEEVQVVVTGGRVWGEVSNSFTETFTSTSGRGPYMWVNWPCSDNSKNHLIMGGYSTFLHPGTDPEKIQGIVLNPMQQSEPSKVGIFGNAAYSWHIWDTAEEADQAWEDSFSFVDHNSAVDTAASKALRELSKHMMNQNMDSRVTPLEESVEFAKLLDPAKEKIADGTITAEELDAIAAEFTVLQKAAKTYREQGDKNMLGDIDKDYSGQDANEQMGPWIDAWDDTTAAALAYIEALKAWLAGDETALVKQFSAGQQAFTEAQSHGLFYVDHQEYAEVGVQHIVPFIRAMDSMLSRQVQELADPSVVTQTYISNVFTTPTTGTIEDILDGDDSTVAVFQNPNYLDAGDYVGVSYNKPITLNSIRLAFNGGKNHFYHSKLQTSADGETWTDVPGAEFERPLNSTEPIEVTGLNIENVKAVRLIATADNVDDLWLGIQGIDVNKVEKETLDPYTATGVELENLNATYGSTKELMIDGNPSTITYLKDPNSDSIAAGAAVIVDLGSSKPVGEVTITGHASSANDRPSQGVVEVSDDKATWTKLGDLSDAVTSTVSGNVTGRYVRIRNTAAKAVWWRVAEITVTPPETVDPLKSVYTNKMQHGYTATLGANTAELFDDPHTMLDNGQYAGLDLLAIRDLTDVELDITGNANPSLQISDNGLVWTTVEPGDLTGKTARYVRVINDTGEATFSVDKLKVGFSTVGEYGALVSSDIEVQSSWGDSREDGNGFDGDMTTVTKFGGNPYEGDTVVYDLGQPVDITSLRIYTQDSQLDYIRDTKVQMSADGATWVDAFEIGDGVMDTDRTTAFGSITDDAKQTDSNYPNVLYYGKDDIANGQGMRYLRLLITADYPNRALAFNELMVNQGAYISTETNAAFSATVIEERGHTPSMMLDGDLTTTYKPSAADGSLTMKFSDAASTKSFRIVQSGQASGASVSGTVYDTTSGTTRTVEFGTLEQSINAFKVPGDTTLLDVTVTWGKTIPELAELVEVSSASTDEAIAAAKDALQARIDEAPADYDQWTDDSKAAYDEAKATAQRVHAGALVEVSSLDSARNAITAAINGAQDRVGDDVIAELTALVNGALTNDGHVYTAVSFADYTDAVQQVTNALAEPGNVTADTAKALTDAVNAAKNALVFSTYQRELAQLAIEDFDVIDANDYTEQSYGAFSDAADAIDDLLAADGTEPAAFRDAVTAYTAAKGALVNVVELKAQIANASLYDETKYTETSWAAYADALKTANGVLKDGTAAQVADALAALKAAEGALELITSKPDTDALDDLIAEMKEVTNESADGEQLYTTASFKSLTEAIAKAEADKAQEDAELNAANMQAMKDARDALVSVAALIAKVEEAGRYDAGNYTTSSYAALTALLAAKDDATVDPVVLGVDTLLDHGTVEQIDERMKAIGAAAGALVYAAKGMTEYVAGITEVGNDNGWYTDQSYGAYTAALKALRELAAKGDAEVNLDDYTAAKDAFEDAAANLAYKDADYSKVDELLDAVPDDLSAYTEESVAVLTKAIAAIERGKDIRDQETVDGYAAALQDAISGLELIDDDRNDPSKPNKPGTSTEQRPGSTADTGSAVLTVAGIALAVALVGLGVLMAARRRRS